jgi:hypothetical protein
MGEEKRGTGESYTKMSNPLNRKQLLSSRWDMGF